jgi:hypothetical protein
VWAEVERLLGETWWRSRWSLVLDADMLEVPRNFAAVKEGRQDGHVAVTVFAFADIDFED